jgi:hypothetical protein
MFKKILIACAIALSMVGASAQIMLANLTQVSTMRVTDHVRRTVVYERVEHNLVNGQTVTLDATTGAWLSTNVESPSGLSWSMIMPEGAVVIRTSFPMRDLRPGQQIVGVVELRIVGKTITFPLSARASYEGGMHIIEVSGAANGFSYAGRSGYTNPHEPPAWYTTTIHMDGRKTTDLFAVRIN